VFDARDQMLKQCAAGDFTTPDRIRLASRGPQGDVVVHGRVSMADAEAPRLTSHAERTYPANLPRAAAAGRLWYPPDESAIQPLCAS